MGWSTTEPTLPSGAAWEDGGSSSATYNNFGVAVTVTFARLSGKAFAAKVVCNVYNGSYGRYYSFGNWFLQAVIDGVADAGDNSFGSAFGYQTFYYTGEAAAGVTVTINVGWNGAADRVITFTAPKLRGGTMYVNVGGAWKEATMFVNVGGVWKEAQAKLNVGGEWK